MTIFEAQIADIAADENKLRRVFPIGTPRTEDEIQDLRSARMNKLMEEESDRFACADHPELLG